MMRHQVPELLRRVSDLSLPVSPPPSRFLRHADAIDPIAEAYAEIYRARYGFPVRVEALERFLEFDLTLPYGWEDIAEPEAIRILAQHDPTSGAIHANNRYAEFFDAHPHLLTSALLHELGHVALRHGELYADAGMPFLPGMQMPSPFLHRIEWLPWGISEDLLKRAVKVGMMDDRVRAILKLPRCEPDWVYSQAQRFAAAFMIPHTRLDEHVQQMRDLTRWQAVYEIARQFATSATMMRYRLEQLGYM
jgi:IrrE N-terminal-like domain